MNGWSAPGRIGIEVAALDALGEVDVAPAALDVPEQLMELDLLVVGDGRLDVPVAERPPVGRLHGDGMALVLDEDLAGRDRVDGRAVGRRDVDAEVERVARVLHARIVEEAAHGVLAIERLDGPGIGRHRPGPSGEVEAVDVRVVRAEPVAEAAAADLDRPRHLPVGPSRRRERPLRRTRRAPRPWSARRRSAAWAGPGTRPAAGCLRA